MAHGPALQPVGIALAPDHDCTGEGDKDVPLSKVSHLADAVRAGARRSFRVACGLSGKGDLGRRALRRGRIDGRHRAHRVAAHATHAGQAADCHQPHGGTGNARPRRGRQVACGRLHHGRADLLGDGDHAVPDAGAVHAGQL
ncbi:hypothetical protein SDC9_126976 [bioreactor metagenome]|uniref:Uncharacterized protein n=1 Tax=bioreactor metagenome TaxID=1076179 RepID=A0A645CSP5_9ZZZZ